MGVDFTDLLYRPLFDTLGVPSTLVLNSGTFYPVALDKTIGVALQEAGGITVQTEGPMVELIMADLIALGITVDLLDDQSITLNGKTWKILAHRMNPSHSGESDGTVYLILEGSGG
jgi:hypothetical protein